MKKIFVVLNLLLLMIVFGYSVIKEEKNLKKATFYIKTVPVDPRSLIHIWFLIMILQNQQEWK